MRTPHWWKTDGVAGRIFTTKEALKSEIRAIVGRTKIGVAIKGDDLIFLLDVLSHHYQWEDKRGCGIDNLATHRFVTPYGSSTGLLITRVDGSTVDISWQVPLTPPTAKANATLAARNEILGQRNEASANIPINAPCPLCGRPLQKGGRHVDHKPPHTFSSLFEAFVELHKGMTYEAVELHEDGNARMRFSDTTLADDWREFHKRLATLRVIHIEENLGRRL